MPGFIAPESDRIAAPSLADQLGRPVVRTTTEPKTPPAQTPAQARKDQLEVVKLERELNPTAVKPEPNPERYFQSDVLLKKINDIREMAKKDMTLGNVGGQEYFAKLPVIGQNSANMHAALKQLQGDLIQQKVKELSAASGGKGVATLANSETEAARMAASVAALDPTQGHEQFLKGLNDAEQFYRRAYATSQGLDPQNPTVAKRFGIRVPADDFKDRARALISQGGDVPALRKFFQDNGKAFTPDNEAWVKRGMAARSRILQGGQRGSQMPGVLVKGADGVLDWRPQ